LKELDAMIRKNPANAGAYMAKGGVYVMLGNTEQTKQNFTQALKLDPNQKEAANELAYILADERQDLDAALGWAQLARKKQPENPAFADTLGWMYYKLGNQILTRNQFEFAVSKQSGNP